LETAERLVTPASDGESADGSKSDGAGNSTIRSDLSCLMQLIDQMEVENQDSRK
jgi:hypothetical protein